MFADKPKKPTPKLLELECRFSDAYYMSRVTGFSVYVPAKRYYAQVG
jgi:hypothetical protein